MSAALPIQCCEEFVGYRLPPVGINPERVAVPRNTVEELEACPAAHTDKCLAVMVDQGLIVETVVVGVEPELRHFVGRAATGIRIVRDATLLVLGYSIRARCGALPAPSTPTAADNYRRAGHVSWAVTVVSWAIAIRIGVRRRGYHACAHCQDGRCRNHEANDKHNQYPLRIAEKIWEPYGQIVRWTPETGQAAKRESSLGAAVWPRVRHDQYAEETWA